MRFKEILHRIDLLADARQAMLADRTCINLEWKLGEESPERIHFYSKSVYYQVLRFLRNAPTGWSLQNQVTSNRLYQQFADDLIEKPFQPGKFVYKARRPYPYQLLVLVDSTLRETGARRAIFFKNSVSQALMACALEEYCIDHGNFPETLDALVPSYLDAIPPDPLTGKFQIYRRTRDGDYLLYSVDWNLADDGGTVAMKESGAQDEGKGDWVWFGSPQTTLTKE